MDDLRNIEDIYADGPNANKPFVYKEEYWDNALVELKKAERAILIKKFLIGSVALLILVGGIFFLTNSFDDYQLNDKVTLNQNDSNNSSLQNLTPNNTNSSEYQVDNNQVGVFEDSNYETSDFLSDNGSEILDKTNKNLNKNGNSNNRDYSTNSKTKTAVNTNSTLKENKRNPKGNSNKEGKSKNNSSAVETDRNPLTDDIKNNDKVLVDNSEKSSNNNSKDKQGVSGFNDSDLSKAGSHSLKTENNKGSDLNSSSKAGIVTSKKTRIPEELIIINYTKIDKAYEPIKFPKRGNTSQNAKIPLIDLEKAYRFSLVLNLGFNIHKGLNNNDPYVDFAYLGGELYYQISNRLNMSVGFSSYNRSGIGYVIQNTYTQYGFGKKEITEVTALDKVYFIEVPVKINYHVGKNHFIGMGGAYSSIVSGENRSWNNEIDYGPDGVSLLENQNSKKLGGFSNTYSNSMELFASYEYRFRRFGGELRYYYGLNDFTINETLKNNQFDRNSRFLISLKYLLFRK